MYGSKAVEGYGGSEALHHNVEVISESNGYVPEGI